VQRVAKAFLKALCLLVLIAFAAACFAVAVAPVILVTTAARAEDAPVFEYPEEALCIERSSMMSFLHRSFRGSFYVVHSHIEAGGQDVTVATAIPSPDTGRRYVFLMRAAFPERACLFIQQDM